MSTAATWRGDEVARRDRLLVIAVLAASTLAGAVVVFAGTLAGRRDFGRRRALGATRAQLVFLVVAGTFWPAAGGALIGMVTGGLTSARSYSVRLTPSTPPLWRS